MNPKDIRFYFQTKEMSLESEYLRWKNNTSIARSGNLSEKKRYELRHILERYILTVDNRIPNASEKMNEELTRKAINLTGLTSAFQKPLRMTVNGEPNETETSITFQDCVFSKTPRVIELLTKVGLVDCLKICLRYESTLPRRQQLRIPSQTAKLLYDVGFHNEGFASPIDSHFLTLGGRFCSLYPEVDRPAGSLGSFFSINPLQYEGGWIVHPPMIESLINHAAFKVLIALEQSDGRKPFFFVMAGWSDCEGYRRLKSSKYLLHSKVLESNKHHYECIDGKRVPTPFKSFYFILGRPDEIKVKNPPEFTKALERTWTF